VGEFAGVVAGLGDGPAGGSGQARRHSGGGLGRVA
jgi:hypothetical protein